MSIEHGSRGQEPLGTVTRPAEFLDPDLIFPISDQQQLTEQVSGYLAEGSHITFLTFDGVDHMGSARKFFYIKAARDWLFDQVKASYALIIYCYSKARCISSMARGARTSCRTE